MPLVGDICGSNGIDLANESGSDNGNEICLKQLGLLINLANSGNEKHVKLASDLLDLNFVQEMVLIRLWQMKTKILNKEYQ